MITIDTLRDKLRLVSLDIDTDGDETIYLIDRSYIVRYRDRVFGEIGVTGSSVIGYCPDGRHQIRNFNDVDFFELNQILVD